MNASSDAMTKVLEQLAATPDRLASVSAGISQSRLRLKSDEAIWSANDVLAHLRSCADVWGKSILTMITQDHPILRYISPRAWPKKTKYPELEFHQSLAAFTQQRNGLLESLHMLDAEGWSRGAIFTGITKGCEQTVLSYANRLANHEGEHCHQIEELLK